MRYVNTLPTVTAIARILRERDSFIWSFAESPWSVLVKRVDGEVQVYIQEQPGTPTRITPERGMSIEDLILLTLDAVACHLTYP